MVLERKLSSEKLFEAQRVREAYLIQTWGKRLQNIWNQYEQDPENQIRIPSALVLLEGRCLFLSEYVLAFTSYVTASKQRLSLKGI